MAISEENKRLLAQNDRGVAFPKKAGDETIVDEVGTFNTDVGVTSQLRWEAKNTDASVYGPGTVIECKLLSTDNVDSEITTEADTEFIRLGGRYGFSTFPNITYSYVNPANNETINKSGFPIVDDPNVKNLVEFAIDPKRHQDVNYTVEYIVEFDYSDVANASVDELQFDGGGGDGISLLLESSTTDNPARLLLEESTKVEDYGITNASDDPSDSTIQTIIDEDGNFEIYVDEADEKAYRKDVFVFNQSVRNFTGEQIGEVIRAAIAGEPTPEIASAAGEALPDIILPDAETEGDLNVQEQTVEEEEESENVDVEVEEVVVTDPAADFVFIDSEGHVLLSSLNTTLKGSLLDDTTLEINSKLESIT